MSEVDRLMDLATGPDKPEVQFDPYSVWADSQPDDADVSTFHTGYADYLREEHIKAKAYDPAVEQDILKGMYGSLVKDGRLQEGDLEGFEKLTAPPEMGFDRRADFFLSSVEFDEDENSDYRKVQRYVNHRDQITSGELNIMGEVSEDQTNLLEQRRLEAEDVMSRHGDDDLKRLAVKNGELAFASVLNDKGQRVVIAGDRALETDLLTGLKQSKMGGVTLSDAMGAQAELEVPDGFTLPRFQLRRVHEAATGLEELIKKDAFLQTQVAGHAQKMASMEHDKGDRLSWGLDQFGQAATDMFGRLLGIAGTEENRIEREAQQLAGNRPVDQVVRSLVKRLNASGENDFTQDEIMKAYTQVVLNDATANGRFEFHDGDDEVGKNIRTFGYGAPSVHPAAMANEDVFNKMLAARPDISDSVKDNLRANRKAYLTNSFDDTSNLLGRSGVADEWHEALIEGRQQGKKNYEILNDFLADEKNFSAFSERAKGVAWSLWDAGAQLIAAVPAAMGADWAQDTLVASAQRNSDRRQVAQLFGEDFGFGQDIAETIAPMLTDVAATAALAAVTSKAGGVGAVAYQAGKQGARITAKGIVKGLTTSAFRNVGGKGAKEAAKNLVVQGLIKESIKDVSGKGSMAAIKAYNGLLAEKIAKHSKLPAIFVPAATRSGGATYGSVYNTLSQDPSLSKEEIHDRALGAALGAGALTGLITATFSAFGRGGVEDALLKGLNYKQAKAIIGSLSNTSGISKATFNKVVADQAKATLKKFEFATARGLIGDAKDEAIEEGLDQLFNGFIEDAALHQNTPMVERFQQSMYAAALGGTMGAGATGIRKIAGSIAPDTYEKAAQARQLQDQFITDVTARLENTDSPMTAKAVAALLTSKARRRGGKAAATQESDVAPDQAEEQLELGLDVEPTADAAPATPTGQPSPTLAAIDVRLVAIERELGPRTRLVGDSSDPDTMVSQDIRIPTAEESQLLELRKEIVDREAPSLPTKEVEDAIAERMLRIATLMIEPASGRKNTRRRRRQQRQIQRLEDEITFMQENNTTDIPAEIPKRASVEQPTPTTPAPTQEQLDLDLNTEENATPEQIIERLNALPPEEARARVIKAIDEMTTPNLFGRQIDMAILSEAAAGRTAPFSSLFPPNVAGAAEAAGADPQQAALNNAKHVDFFMPDQEEDLDPAPKRIGYVFPKDPERRKSFAVGKKVEFDLKPFREGDVAQEEELAEALSAVQLAQQGYPVRFGSGIKYGTIVDNKRMKSKSDFVANAVYTYYPTIETDSSQISETRASTRQRTYFDPAQNKTVTGRIKMPLDADGRGVFTNDPVVVAEMLAHNIPVRVPYGTKKINPAIKPYIKRGYVTDVRMPSKDGSMLESAVTRVDAPTDLKPNNNVFENLARVQFRGRPPVENELNELLVAHSELGAERNMSDKIGQLFSSKNFKMDSEFADYTVQSTATEFALTSHLYELHKYFMDSRRRRTLVDSPKGKTINPSSRKRAIAELRSRLSGDPELSEMAEMLLPMLRLKESAKPTHTEVVVQFIEDFVLNNPDFDGGVMPTFDSLFERTFNRYAQQQRERGVNERNKALVSIDTEEAGTNVIDTQQLRNGTLDVGGIDPAEQIDEGAFLNTVTNVIDTAIDSVDTDPMLRDALNDLALQSIYTNPDSGTVSHVQRMDTRDLMARIGTWMAAGDHATRPAALEFTALLEDGSFRSGIQLRNALRLTSLFGRIDGDASANPDVISEVRRQLSESLGQPVTEARARNFVRSMDGAMRRRLSRAVIGKISDADALAQNTIEAERLGLKSGDPESVVAALEQIRKRSKNKSHRLVAELLLEDKLFIEKVGFSMGQSDANIAGEYVRHTDGKHSVFLNMQKSNGIDLENVLLEEYVHAFMSDTLAKPDELLNSRQQTARRRLEGLYQIAQREYRRVADSNSADTNAVLEAGLENMDEFVANFLLDPDFQKFIKTLDTPIGQRGFFARILDAMVAMFRKISPKENALYAAALKDVVDLSKSTMRASAVPFKQQAASAVHEASNRIQEAGRVMTLRTSVMPATPTTDADYMAAVEAGDMEAAQRMVDQAARAAGYTIEAYHGSVDSRGQTVMDRERTYTISPDSSEYSRITEELFSLVGDKSKEASDRRSALIEAMSGKAVTGTMVFHSSRKEVADAYSTKLIYKQRDEEGQQPKTFRSYLKFENPLVIDAKGALFADYNENSQQARDLEKAYAEGYDGIIYQNIQDNFYGKGALATSDTIYVTLYPEQMKLADPVTRDDAGNVIPLSQRFDVRQDSILYTSTPEAGSTQLISNSQKDLTTEQQQAEFEEVVGFLRERMPYGVQFKHDPNMPAAMGADGDFILINPKILMRGLESFDRLGKRKMVDIMLHEEIGHEASFGALTQAEIDGLVDSLSDEQYAEIASEYYRFNPDQKQQALANLQSEDPAVVAEEKFRLAEEKLRMRLQEITRGYTTEEDAEFWRSKPSLMAILKRYIGGVINKWAANRRLNGASGTMDAALTKVMNEMQAIQLGFSRQKLSKTFNPDLPAESVEAYMRALNADPLGDIEDAQEAAKDLSMLASSALSVEDFLGFLQQGGLEMRDATTLVEATPTKSAKSSATDGGESISWLATGVDEYDSDFAGVSTIQQYQDLIGYDHNLGLEANINRLFFGEDTEDIASFVAEINHELDSLEESAADKPDHRPLRLLLEPDPMQNKVTFQTEGVLTKFGQFKVMAENIATLVHLNEIGADLSQRAPINIQFTTAPPADIMDAMRSATEEQVFPIQTRSGAVDFSVRLIDQLDLAVNDAVSPPEGQAGGPAIYRGARSGINNAALIKAVDAMSDESVTFYVRNIQRADFDSDLDYEAALDSDNTTYFLESKFNYDSYDNDRLDQVVDRIIAAEGMRMFRFVPQSTWDAGRADDDPYLGEDARNQAIAFATRVLTAKSTPQEVEQTKAARREILKRTEKVTPSNSVDITVHKGQIHIGLMSTRNSPKATPEGFSFADSLMKTVLINNAKIGAKAIDTEAAGSSRSVRSRFFKKEILKVFGPRLMSAERLQAATTEVNREGQSMNGYSTWPKMGFKPKYPPQEIRDIDPDYWRMVVKGEVNSAMTNLQRSYPELDGGDEVSTTEINEFVNKLADQAREHLTEFKEMVEGNPNNASPDLYWALHEQGDGSDRKAAVRLRKRAAKHWTTYGGGLDVEMDIRQGSQQTRNFVMKFQSKLKPEKFPELASIVSQFHKEKASWEQSRTNTPEDSDAMQAIRDKYNQRLVDEGITTTKLFSSFGQNVGDSTSLDGVDFGNVVQLLEMPMYEYQAYKAPKGWLSRLFMGDVGRPVKQLIDQREAFKRASTRLVKQYKEKMDKLIVEAYGDPSNTDWDLIAQAQGYVDGGLLNEDTIQQLDDEHMARIDKINQNDQLTPREKKIMRDSSRAKRDKSIENAEEQALEQAKRASDDALTKLGQRSSELAAHIKSMRRDLIQPIQQKMKDAGLTDEISAKIDRTGGIYITRAYRMFNDPTFAERVRTDPQYAELRDRAMKFFEDELYKNMYNSTYSQTYDKLVDQGMDAGLAKAKAEDKATKKAKKAVRKAYDKAGHGHTAGSAALEAFLDKYSERTGVSPQSANGLKVLENNLKKRKDVPKVIRELLGEYGPQEGTDLIVRTFSTVANVAAQQTFLNNVAEVGKQQGFLVDQATYEAARDQYEDYVPLRKGNSTNPNDPLNNLYGPRDMVEAMQDTLNPSFNVDHNSTSEKAVRGLAVVAQKLTGQAMAMKTLGSVGFFLRNALGNFLFFGPAQGFVRVDKMMGRSLMFNRTSLNAEGQRLTDAQVQEYLTELTGLNIVGDELHAGLLRQLLNGEIDPDSALAKINKAIDEIPVIGKTKKGAAALQKKLADLSAAIDGRYKIAYYENELSMLLEAKRRYPQSDIGRMSEYDLKRMAAEKVLMTAQSLSQAPPLAQSLTKSGFGMVFAPFIRFKMEVPRIVINTYKLAARERKSDNPMVRARGTRRFFAMTGVLGGFSAAAPAALAALSGVGEEEDEALRKSMPEYLRGHTFFYLRDDKGNLRSLNLTYLNPFSLIVDPFLRSLPKLVKGDISDAVGQFTKGMIFDTYLDDQILAGSMMDVLKNRNSTTDDPIWIEGVDGLGASLQKSMTYLYENSYQPRLLKDMIDAKNATGGDYEGFSNSPLGQLLDGAYPIKVHEVDLQKQYRRFIYSHLDRMSAVNKQKYELYSKESFDPDKIDSIYQRELDGKRALNQEMLRVARGYEGLGLSARDQFGMLKNRGVGKDRARLMFHGVMDRPDINKKFADGLVERGYAARLNELLKARDKRARYLHIEDPD